MNDDSATDTSSPIREMRPVEARIMRSIAKRDSEGRLPGSDPRQAGKFKYDTNRANPPGPSPGLKPVYTIRELCIALGWSRFALRRYLLRNNIPTDPPMPAPPGVRAGVVRIYLSDLQLHAPKLERSLRVMRDAQDRAAGLAPRTF